jgi:hypothetical protein
VISEGVTSRGAGLFEKLTKLSVGKGFELNARCVGHGLNPSSAKQPVGVMPHNRCAGKAMRNGRPP